MSHRDMETAFSLTDRGSAAVNEDFAYLSERHERTFGIVLDGATGLVRRSLEVAHRRYQTEAQWLSHAVGTEMARQMLTGLALDDAMDKAIAYACHEMVNTSDISNGPGLPEATLAAFELRDGTFHLRWAGDSPIYVLSRGGTVTTYQDAVLVDLDEQALAEMQRRRKLGMDIKQQVELVYQALRENRRKANQPGGYPILMPCAKCLGIGHHVEMDGADVKAIAIMSDGMAAAFERYGIADIRDFLENGTYLDAVSVMDTMRAAETNDSYGQRWARFKVSDDASIVMIRLR